MRFATLASPHGARLNQVNRVMGQVILALIPGALALTYFFGWGTLINLLLASLTALGAEALVLKLRGRPVLPTLGDLSALVTALLFALAVPPTLPAWLTVLGTLFAILVAKHLYGGLGQNPFNPAMAAYVFLLISYPVQMTTWPQPLPLGPQPLDFLDSLNLILTGALPPGLTLDAISGATPLDHLRVGLGLHQDVDRIREGPQWGTLAGLGWEWVAGGYLLGGLWLLYRRVISWRIPVAMLGTLALLAGLFHFIDPQIYPVPSVHVFGGGAMLGAFFIATDPVTACTTPRGQLIQGAAIGLVVFCIRSWGGYPDAVAFSVLLLNIAAPTLDYYTQPRVFGTSKARPPDG